MALDFPNSPSVNQSFNAGGKTWVYNGTKWVLLGVSLNQTVADGSITAAKLTSDSVTAAKISANAVTEAKIGAGAVTQAKLTSGLSGITVTTTALRDTVIPSPFTGQFAFLTDTNAFIRWNGSAWVTAIVTTPTEAPTSLALVSATATTAIISFAAGANGGSAITNYQYALSTNSGASYGSYNALSPADATSPITITGLSLSTAYHIKLKAVNAQGVSNVESNALSFSTSALTVDYLVVAGGGGSGTNQGAGGGGAGGLRSTVTATGGGGLLETISTLTPATNYTVTVGSGGAVSTNGNNSVFNTITSIGGGKGSNGTIAATASSGGSGGGGSGQGTTNTGSSGGAGTANQGYAGGSGMHVSAQKVDGGGGGGAGAVGVSATTALYPSAPAPNGGIGVATTITGSSLYFAGGGGGGGHYIGSTAGNGGLGGGGGGGGNNNQGTGGGSALNSGTSGSGINGGAGGANTGGGGGGGGGTDVGLGAAGGSGVVILRYPTDFTITIGVGLTGSTSTVGSNKVTTITAGTGNVSWALA